jgi:hypothetical protein
VNMISKHISQGSKFSAYLPREASNFHCTQGVNSD